MTVRHHEQPELAVQIRWLIRRDMADVLRIEHESFEFPWTEEDFLSCLRQRNCIGMVAEHEQKIVGFMIYELHKSKLNILNFAVGDETRRSQVGTQMVQKLVDKLSQQRRNEIILEVRETNLSAQLFFSNHGFRGRFDPARPLRRHNGRRLHHAIPTGRKQRHAASNDAAKSNLRIRRCLK